MRFAIIGAGGVGGSLGAALLGAGHDVLFVARGESRRALERSGLTVRHATAPFRAERIAVTSDPSDQAPSDAVLLCIKRYDLVNAIEAHAGWLASCGCVITLQNGLDAPRTAARMLPSGKVVAGTVQVIAKLLEPGVILREGDTLQINLAEPGGGVSERLQQLHAALSRSIIGAEMHAEMATMLWLKFLMVACSSSINAATRQGFYALANNPAFHWLLEIAMQEALAVARVLDVPLPRRIETDTRNTLKRVFAHGGKASLLTDLERGNRLEIEWLSGAIHQMGRQTGVPTPLHTAVYRELLPIADGVPWERGHPALDEGGTPSLPGPVN